MNTENIKTENAETETSLTTEEVTAHNKQAFESLKKALKDVDFKTSSKRVEKDKPNANDYDLLFVLSTIAKPAEEGNKFESTILVTLQGSTCGLTEAFSGMRENQPELFKAIADAVVEAIRRNNPLANFMAKTGELTEKERKNPKA